ncbi:unnamed protein product [Rotaria socialis]|uniref:Cilia- and flagella-associated protein 157 n=1 Tax=Rotaria socialis TaxID=392032 RepID=A0A820Q5K5_9BILA|nr:unnamed protein product [Rotaria socialis]CAF3308780.1 unnamed protein product [Rotaria socialis]CAF3361297.1 unnamed protein product [Rotaria socialis]CAF3399855.1 unnamed protein product [Rotaria socialis]CAF3546675.1 unnamed protein product [Rotaria socialis]
MGPKKKGKKKNSDKKKKTVTEEGASGGPEIQMEQGTKQFYLTQLESLQKKVTDLQEECDIYLVSQQKNSERLETLKEIRLGSRAYLGRQMDEINFEITHLNGQLRELDELKEAERTELTKQINDLKTKDLQETKEKNENENHMLRSKLNSLDELKTKKETLLNEINQLDEQLKQQEHEYQEDIYHKEKDAVLEKDKLRKEMGTRVSDLSSEFRRVSKMQVVQTTRQIILENVRLNNQMALIENDYTDFEAKNGNIREGKKTKSLEYTLLDERERMMAKKNRKTYQLIEKLSDECTANEQFISGLDEKLSSFNYTQQLIDELEQLNEKTETRRNQALEENELLRRSIAKQEDILSEYEHDIKKVKHVIDNTVQALSHILQGSSETLETGRKIDIRLRGFENILKLLNVATQLGIGPKLNDLAAKNESDPLSTTIEVDELPSPRQPLGALKKLKTKSVAVQTSVSNRNPTSYHVQTDSSIVPLHPSTVPKRRSSLLSN